jgi:AcrR family transcriptional regulator
MRTKTPELDQRILDTAACLFAGNHFHAVRMEDLAAEADVGKGTLYRYFRDKEELYLALLSRASGQIRQQVDEATQENREPLAQLEAVTETILRFFDEQRHIFELIQQAEASRGTNHPWQGARDSVIKKVIEIFEEGERRGAFKVDEPLITALLLLGGVRAIIRFGPKQPSDQLAKRIVDTVLFGSAHRNEPSPASKRRRSPVTIGA